MDNNDKANYRLPGNLTIFQEILYKHLIEWKWKYLTKETRVFKKKKKIENKEYYNQEYYFDIFLPLSADNKYPHIYPPVKSILENHSKNYPFRLHTHFYHMASSQAANINLFLPILENENADIIFKNLNGAPDDFDRIAREELYHGYRIEFWDSNDQAEKGLLRDHSSISGTDADIAIAYYSTDNKLNLWLIEHKLSEKEFTTCGAYKSKNNMLKENCSSASFNDIVQNPCVCYYHTKRNFAYWELTKKHIDFFSGFKSSAGCPFKEGLNQLWRNQLLGLGLEGKKSYQHVYFSVVHHPENKMLDNSIATYRKFINYNPKFSTFTSRDILHIIDNIPDPEIQKWKEWYDELYMIDKSKWNNI